MEDWTVTYAQFLKNRKVGATALNEFSSRSHAILRLVVCHSFYRSLTSQLTVSEGTNVRQSKFYLIDLAGSEDNRKYAKA